MFVSIPLNQRSFHFCVFPQIWVFTVLSAVQGFFYGGADSGNGIVFLRLHGDKANPWLQAMHFSYAVGTTVCFFHYSSQPLLFVSFRYHHSLLDGLSESEMNPLR